MYDKLNICVSKKAIKPIVHTTLVRARVCVCESVWYRCVKADLRIVFTC